MATGSFDPRSMIVKFEPELFEEFVVQQGLEMETGKKEKAEEQADSFLRLLEQQDDRTAAPIWAALNDISDLSGRSGVEYLRNVADGLKKDVDQEALNKLPNNHSRSLWFYLNFPELFNQSVSEFLLDNQTSWKSVVLPLDDISQLTSQTRQLEEAIKKIYTNIDPRCKIIELKRADRICLVAYIEDQFTNHLGFQGNEVKTNKAFRPVFRAFIQYWIDEKKLEVKIKGGQPKVEALHRAVIEDCLGLNYGDFEKSSYSLDVLRELDPNPLNVVGEPLVKFVQLKFMSLRSRADGGRVDLTIGPSEKPGVEDMKNLLKYRNINFDYFDILQARIRVMVEIGNKDRSVTTVIGHQKGHDLRCRDQDLVVRKLFARWSIDTSKV